MVSFKRKFEVKKGPSFLIDRQSIGIAFQPNGYESAHVIVVRATMTNKQTLNVSITPSTAGEEVCDIVEKAESFLAAYAQAIVDMKRIQEAFDSGLRDADEIMNHVEDQYVIDQLNR